MAEPVGLLLGVIGIYGACLDGYKLVTSGIQADADISEAVSRLQILRSRLRAWGDSWGFETARKEDEPAQVRLEAADVKNFEFDVSPDVKVGILTSLARIADIFSNAHQLKKEYGLSQKKPAGLDGSKELRDQAVADILEGRQRWHFHVDPRQPDFTPSMRFHAEKQKLGISLLKRCRWAIKDSAKFDALLSRLREYTENLEALCDRRRWEVMRYAMVNQILEGLDQRQQLMQMHKAAEKEVQVTDASANARAGNELLVELTDFKARLNNGLMRPAPVIETGFYRLHAKSHWNNNGSCLAYSIEKQQVVLVDWRSYMTDGVEDTSAILEIQKLADFLCCDGLPKGFRIPQCLGYFKESSVGRYGFVYEIPKYISSFTKLEKGGLSARCPVTLSTLLSKPVTVLDLGIRFRLAKQLVETVFVIHTSGFLHKNIRPDSIIFFPEQSYQGGPSTTGRMNLRDPYLMGWSFTRSETPGDELAGYYGFGDTDVKKDHHRQIFSDQRRQTEITLDLYQHPQKLWDPSCRYRKAFDIYSMGLVLLEIGLWQSLTSLSVDIGDPEMFRRYLAKNVVPDLRGQCGSIYAGVVAECLNVNATEIDDDLTRNLYWKVAGRLAACYA